MVRAVPLHKLHNSHGAEEAPEAPSSEPWPIAYRDRGWASLDSEQKRERLLSAAGRVFTTQGLDAPMPTVAAAAGAGVGSLYRHYPSKRDLLAALVVRRLAHLTVRTLAACDQPGDRWSAFTGLLSGVVEAQGADDFLGQAWHQVSDHEDVAFANERCTAAIDLLLAQARDEGRLRPDASATDIRLLFTATRAAKQVEPHARERMLTLLLDGLDLQRDQPLRERRCKR